MDLVFWWIVLGEFDVGLYVLVVGCVFSLVCENISYWQWLWLLVQWVKVLDSVDFWVVEFEGVDLLLGVCRVVLQIDWVGELVIIMLIFDVDLIVWLFLMGWLMIDLLVIVVVWMVIVWCW